MVCVKCYMVCLGVGDLWFPFLCVCMLLHGFGGLLAYLFVPFSLAGFSG